MAQVLSGFAFVVNAFKANGEPTKGPWIKLARVYADGTQQDGKLADYVIPATVANARILYAAMDGLKAGLADIGRELAAAETPTAPTESAEMAALNAEMAELKAALKAATATPTAPATPAKPATPARNGAAKPAATGADAIKTLPF